jgi:dienelactone hydrolase
MKSESLFGHLLLGSLAVALSGAVLLADRPGDTAQASGNVWDASAFHYTKQHPLVVEETTPNAAQVDWRNQPPKLPAGTPAPVETTQPAKPYSTESMDIVRLRFRDIEGADVPALLVTPRGRHGPFPVVIALHGLHSNKAQVVAQVAPTLTKRGFAVLAPDLPTHGERPGDARKMFDQRDFRAFVHRCHQAIMDVRQCIDVAESRPELDTRQGVILVGYSMGAIFDSIVGPADPRVKAMCLMVGGTVEFPPVFSMVPQIAALQPQLAISHFAGRPLLMLNAKADRVITREMSDRLYAAAPDPKQQIWYDSGHLLPAQAYEECARWVASTWKQVIAEGKAAGGDAARKRAG